MSEEKDRELVNATLAGDSEAFEALIAKHERPLFNAAYRITGNREDAMDATQTALVKAYDRLGTFDPAYRFFSWIFRIVVNESLNVVNLRNRYTEHSPDFDLSLAVEIATVAAIDHPETACGRAISIENQRLDYIGHHEYEWMAPNGSWRRCLLRMEHRQTPSSLDCLEAAVTQRDISEHVLLELVA